MLSVGVVLLGSGAENLLAEDKRNLARDLIFVAAHLVDLWTREINAVDFKSIKKKLLDDGIFNEIDKEKGISFSEQQISDAKLLFNGVFDIMEFSLLASPLRSVLNFLCERARSNVLARSLERAAEIEEDRPDGNEADERSIKEGIEGIIYGTWLSDVDTARGNKPLHAAIKNLPNAVFLRLGIASHLMTRVYWGHWQAANKHMLLEAAEQVIKPFMTITSKAEIMRDIDQNASPDEASTTARAILRGRRPSKEEKRKRRSQRRSR